MLAFGVCLLVKLQMDDIFLLNLKAERMPWSLVSRRFKMVKLTKKGLGLPSFVSRDLACVED